MSLGFLLAHGILVSGFVGDLWQVLSPFDTVAAVIERLRSRGSDGTWCRLA